MEGEHELALVDQAVLKREQSEEAMAVGGGGHDMAPIIGGRSGAIPSLRGRRGVHQRRSDYRKSGMRLHLCRGALSDGRDRGRVSAPSIAEGSLRFSRPNRARPPDRMTPRLNDLSSLVDSQKSVTSITYDGRPWSIALCRDRRTPYATRLVKCGRSARTPQVRSSSPPVLRRKLDASYSAGTSTKIPGSIRK